MKGRAKGGALGRVRYLPLWNSELRHEYVASLISPISRYGYARVACDHAFFKKAHDQMIESKLHSER